jgi:hypothetical protein
MILIFIFLIGIATLEIPQAYANNIVAQALQQPVFLPYVGNFFEKSLHNVLLGFFNGYDNIASLILKFMNGLATICFNSLIWIYSQIGTILIPIPNLADIQNYSKLAQVVVKNIYQLMSVLGLIIALVFFIINVAISSSGFSNRKTSFLAVFRLIVSIGILISWPLFFSFTSNWLTSLGFLIFSQNRIEASGVFQGLKNMNKFPMKMASSSNSNIVIPNTLGPNFLIQSKKIWKIIFYIASFFCLIGIIYAGYKYSNGNSEAIKILSGAILGLILILSAKFLLIYIFHFSKLLTSYRKLSLIRSNNSINNFGIFSVPSQYTFSHFSENSFLNNQSFQITENLVASFLKIVISFWGLTICIGVILSKFYQVVSLIILFFLGPIFAGFIAHPNTEHISWSGFNLILKLQLYSVIWSIALVILYLIGSIRFININLATENLFSAFAILAGLKLMQNSDGIAQLFVGGNTHLTDAKSDWSQFYQSIIAGGVIENIKSNYRSWNNSKGSTIGERSAGVVGGIVGTIVPFIGPEAGFESGKNFFKFSKFILGNGDSDSSSLRKNETDAKLSEILRELSRGKEIRRIQRNEFLKDKNDNGQTS